MDAIELALRKCLNVLVSSNTITERKRNVETFIELLKDNRIHDLLDRQTLDENTSKCSITWDEMFNVIREYTINELASIRTKSAKTLSPDIKYQEALKLFKSLIENSNTHGPQLDGRALLESILSIITSEVWSSCSIVIKELSHLLINHVLRLHKYLNELREQEWIDLCELYMSLSKYSNKTIGENDQALYSSYLRFIVEQLVIYNDLDSNKSNIRRDLFEFLRIQIENIKNSNHFSVIENFLCSLNDWSWKYLFDMPEEIFHLANELLPSLIDIWRRKCSDKPKTEIIKFSRLQMSIHHPYQRINTLDIYDDIWMKNLRDLNDCLLKEIDEICHKQRLVNRQNQNEFLIRFDLLHLASGVFYQLSLNEISIKNEINDDDELFEPSAKRTRYEHSMSISTSTDSQMKSFQNLFQSIDSHHQAAGFQIVSLQIEREMKLTATDCDYYLNVLKRFFTDERRPSLLVNALRCLHLLLTETSPCQLTSELIRLIQPLIHIPLCESYVIEILSNKNLSLSNLLSCSSITSLKYIFYSNDQYSIDDGKKLIDKLLPDLVGLYRNNEHDLAAFFTSYSTESTQICAAILIKFCSFDALPNQKMRSSKKSMENEFDQIEYQWSQLKLLIPIYQNEGNSSLQVDFHTKAQACQLNSAVFKSFIEIFDRNLRFIQQLKDKHLGERYRLILHYAFLGIYILDLLQRYFIQPVHPNEEMRKFIETIQILFAELTEETTFFYTKNSEIPFISDLLKHIQNCFCISSSSSFIKPLSPSLNTFPSVLYGFLDAKFLSYLYNYSTQECSSKRSSYIEGIQCPLNHPSDDKFRAFEILVNLCYQALHDDQYSSNSFLSHYCSNYQSNLTLLIRILDEKLSIHLEELSLPDPISYQYLNIYLSHLCLHTDEYCFTFRLNDLEFLCNIFGQAFRAYRRDLLLCQRFLFFLELFLQIFYDTIRERLIDNQNWTHLKKLLEAFWQMTVNKNSLLNQHSRKSIIQMKQILIKDEELNFNECQSILIDPSYIVRVEGYKLCSNLFYDNSPANLLGSFNEDERFSLTTKNHPRKFRLKSSNEQKKIVENILEQNSSSILFLYYLSNISEYLSGRIYFHLLKLGLEKKLSDNLLRHILPSANPSLRSILQAYHQQPSNQIKDFPWQFFNREQYHSFIFSTYFFSSISDRQQLYSLFPDMKSSVIEYFPQLQAILLPMFARKSHDGKQAEEHRQFMEKIITKTEYNRLMKQNLTSIILHILFTFSNDQEKEFSDPWSPEPIQPANNWLMIKHTFDYVKQSMNGKTFIEILVKFTDIGEILLCLSSNLFSIDSLHEQLRLLNVFYLFLTDLLLDSLDNDYLHCLLRDATFILLRYIEKHARRKSWQIDQEELHEKMFSLIYQLLHRLCLKGLDFDPSVYLDHIPNVVSILINHQQDLPNQSIDKILFDIYQVIKQNTDPLFTFLAYVIQKLGYLPIETKKSSHTIITSHYFLYLSHHRSSLPAEWILEMFHEHLETERQKSMSYSNEIDSRIISRVQQRLIECLRLKSNHILAGKCLAKCSLFSRNISDQETIDEDPYEPVPFWILDDLIMFYLIDKEQSIVECTRSTLKSLFQHPIAQEFYQKHPKTDFLQIYSKPFLSPINLITKTQSNFPCSSNPWLIPSTSSFDSWLISLVNSLFKQIDFYYNEKKETGHPYAFLFLQLTQLVQSKIELAIKIFPHLIYCLLLLPTNFNLRQILSKNLTFLIEQLNANKDEKTALYNQIGKLIFRTMNYLRQCPIENVNKRNNGKCSILNFQNHFWLEIDYFQLAKCASKYRCYSSAIIYTDIWTTQQRSILPDNDYLTHLYHSDIDLLSSSSDLIDLFVRIHSNMNEPDEFYGLEKYFQNRPNLCGEFNQLNKNYYDSLFYYDQSASIIDPSKLIQSLRLCGFNHILEQYLHQISSVSNEISYRIQLTSILTGQNHLTQWKIVDEQSNNSIRENLLAIIQRQTRIPSSIIPQLIDHQLWTNVSDLRECSLVNIIDDITSHYQTPENLSKIWIYQPIKDDLFDQNDEIFLTRVTTTNKLLMHNTQDDQPVKQGLLADLVTQLCQNALDSKKLQLCERYLNDLSPLINPSYSHELSFLRAKVLVLRQQDTAGEYLRQLIGAPLPDSIHIRCRLLLCDWLNKTRCETSTTIKQQLDSISNSLQTLDRSSLSLIFESYLAMAYFSDNEYQRLNQLFHSPIFENKRLLITRNQIEYAKQEKLDPVGRYTKVLKRSLDMDRKEIEEQKKLQYSYLISTLTNYFTCLKFFSSLTRKQQKINEIIPRKNSVPEIMITSKCLSYWFANSHNDEVNKALKKNLLQIPTHFFLPFVYQMAARMVLMNEKISAFHSILLEYLSQCILDHPHHVLPVIFALANAHKDAHINQQPANANKKTSNSELIQLNNEINNDPRSRAAQYLLDKCAKDKPQLVDQMRKLNDAYIEAAYWDQTPAKTDPAGKNPVFSRQLRLMHIKDFHEVAVPTITIPIANDGNYKNIETIKNFNPEYAMVGGVNAPKKLICHSSIGRQLPQLLKGKDDLRQDAVMQQLFTVVNRLLEKDDLTSHRSLNIRTYKVVPLTQKSGVLEWCEGTITFGDYLAKDREGAHPRYHPDDWTAMDCRRHIHKVTNASKDERKQAFIHACSKLRPVLRYFFYEYYNQPSIWHKKKQAYAKSIAASSIVGYIVGLGDRHVQNILIDTQSAEVIHIDLGVAFDQGKMLPIPETIPFRLTRDIIDGLGVCGTEGLFKKSCEITLELMRQYADTLITIIEVFLYDPLYQWQLSPQKALQLQQQFDKTNNDSATPSSHRSSGKVSMLPPSTPAPSSSSSTTIAGESVTTDTNKMAERLLLGLRQKLQGVERLNQMTIKAHVNMLIQEATSIDNLSQLFAGWQPYL